ncbi:MAG: hypothetical protein ACXWPS_13665 [Ktedonobacteraceae bacterium]
MTTTLAKDKLAKQKLEAFERLQSEFEAILIFVQEVHRRGRFSTFPVMESVHFPPCCQRQREEKDLNSYKRLHLSAQEVYKM